MPNLVLSSSQKAWIKKLAENGCNVSIDDSQGILETEKSVDKINAEWTELFADLDDLFPDLAQQRATKSTGSPISPR